MVVEIASWINLLWLKWLWGHSTQVIQRTMWMNNVDWHTQLVERQLCVGYGSIKLYYKLFTFLSVDMENLTPWSSQVHPEAQPKGVQANKGC